jgi:hypothetical protein
VTEANVLCLVTSLRLSVVFDFLKVYRTNGVVYFRLQITITNFNSSTPEEATLIPAA